nr:MAG TPA: hypothetical protein [Caudoviricetes sp.]
MTGWSGLRASPFDGTPATHAGLVFRSSPFENVPSFGRI